jgi:hypothetical protein
VEALNIVSLFQELEAKVREGAGEGGRIVGPDDRKAVVAATARREVEVARLIEVDVKRGHLYTLGKATSPPSLSADPLGILSAGRDLSIRAGCR